MKVVFDIPEDEYNYIKNCYPDGEDGERYAYMIQRSGTPLSEVLGEIRREIQHELDRNTSGNEMFGKGLKSGYGECIEDG